MNHTLETIDLQETAERREGIESLPGPAGAPDAGGTLARLAVAPPPWDDGCYWAAFQRYDPMGKTGGDWPNGTNRVQPLRIPDFRDLVPGGIFLLLRLKDGQYLVLLPLTGAQTAAWLSSEGQSLVLNVGTLGTAPLPETAQLPLCAWARDADAYRALRRVWQIALDSPLIARSTRLREEKNYPPIFEYLGWCSWEEYRAKINEALLRGAVRAIEASGLPVRYVLVDDGHADADSRQLRSFDPHPAKFPNGWAPLLSARDPRKIRWMGLWLNFNGYWRGVHPENALGALNEHLLPNKTGSLLPRADFLSSVAFYDALIGAARTAGFDFVKVDNQANNLGMYRGLDHPVRCAVHNQQALEAACARHMDGLINCMAHGPASLFNTRISSVTRCSEDYLVGDAGRARRHLHNSYANIPWLGQTVWGDHDMFHSNDPASGRMMAVSKALSGGPVYLSDAPAAFDAQNIRPLCLEDGRLLRPLAPAAPLPDSLLLDPFADGEPYRAIAPLAGGAAALVAYNLSEPVVPVSGAICADDYRHAGAMLPGGPVAWAVPEGGLVLYLWEAGQARRLDGAYAYTLDTFSDLLALLCPLRHGWAVIGRADKFLSPAAVEVIDVTEAELILRMVESGPLAVWSEWGPPTADGAPGEALGEKLWRFPLPVGDEDRVVRIRRRNEARETQK